MLLKIFITSVYFELISLLLQSNFEKILSASAGKGVVYFKKANSYEVVS